MLQCVFFQFESVSSGGWERHAEQSGMKGHHHTPLILSFTVAHIYNYREVCVCASYSGVWRDGCTYPIMHWGSKLCISSCIVRCASDDFPKKWKQSKNVTRTLMKVYSVVSLCVWLYFYHDHIMLHISSLQTFELLENFPRIWQRSITVIITECQNVTVARERSVKHAVVSLNIQYVLWIPLRHVPLKNEDVKIALHARACVRAIS